MHGVLLTGVASCDESIDEGSVLLEPRCEVVRELLGPVGPVVAQVAAQIHAPSVPSGRSPAMERRASRRHERVPVARLGPLKPLVDGSSMAVELGRDCSEGPSHRPSGTQRWRPAKVGHLVIGADFELSTTQQSPIEATGGCAGAQRPVQESPRIVGDTSLRSCARTSRAVRPRRHCR